MEFNYDLKELYKLNRSFINTFEQLKEYLIKKVIKEYTMLENFGDELYFSITSVKIDCIVNFTAEINFCVNDYCGSMPKNFSINLTLPNDLVWCFSKEEIEEEN